MHAHSPASARIKRLDRMGNIGSYPAGAELLRVIQRGDVESFSRLSMQEPELLISVRDEATGYYPLHLSIASRQLNLAKFIISSG